jgi:hypothetical protein
MATCEVFFLKRWQIKQFKMFFPHQKAIIEFALGFNYLIIYFFGVVIAIVSKLAQKKSLKITITN